MSWRRPALVYARLCALLLGMLALCCSGCGSGNQLDQTWGAHIYPAKNSSLNGLGYLEKLLLQKGASVKVVNRLSPRLDRADCLILVGDTFHPPAKEARDWMEEWLAAETGRTILYFGRDFDAAEYYMEQTLKSQPIDKRVRAGLDRAAVRVTRDDRLYEEMNADYFCRWFFVRVSGAQRTLTEFSGPWSNTLSGPMQWPVRAYLDEPDKALRDDLPTFAPAAVTNPFQAWQKAFRPGRPVPPPPPPTTPPPPTGNGRSVFTSVWVPDDISNAEEWEREWTLAPNCEQLLIGEDGTPLVMRLTSDRYPDSQIITLANGAPLFNGMMVDANLRSICMNIAGEIGDDARIALLPYDRRGIQVSHVPDIENEVAGLSVLMTWPLNILMAHLAFLGLLICVALFPILGRPQSLKSSNVSDFGQHAEALGQLLEGTRDKPYALQMVSDYLRVVRGESLPAWIESELAVPAKLPPTPYQKVE